MKKKISTKNFVRKMKNRNDKRRKNKDEFIESKRANITVDPLLTNPLNSATKLQICAT